MNDESSPQFDWNDELTRKGFKPELISGIILPGGPGVLLDDKDIRKKFEIDLFKIASALKIPALGIFRGY